jgi:hypothetical protein
VYYDWPLYPNYKKKPQKTNKKKKKKKKKEQGLKQIIYFLNKLFMPCWN